MKTLTHALRAVCLSSLLFAGSAVAEDGVAPPPDSSSTTPDADSQARRQTAHDNLAQRRAQYLSLSESEKQARRSSLRQQRQSRRGQHSGRAGAAATGNP